jgi:hypothetical protein
VASTATPGLTSLSTALATAPEDRGSTFPIWCGVKPAPAISLHHIPGREFLIGISGYTTTLSCPFRGDQRSFSPNTRISVNFARWRPHFVAHGRGHGY